MPQNINNTLSSYGQMPAVDYSLGGSTGSPVMAGMGGGQGLTIPSWGQGANTLGAPGATGGFFGNGMGLGMNMPTLQLGVQGLGALSSLWMGSKSLGLAKDQFNFTKDVTNTNLNNQIKSYNSTLEDRTKRASEFNGTSKEDAQAEYERRKLAR